MYLELASLAVGYRERKCKTTSWMHACRLYTPQSRDIFLAGKNPGQVARLYIMLPVVPEGGYTMYVYGGYILTGGKLDDGKPWEGINVLLGEIRDLGDLPLKGIVVKAKRSEDLLIKLRSFSFGCPVDALADFNGRLVSISAVKRP